MSEQVKRYDAVNPDGTCASLYEDVDYGTYVRYEDYATLQAERDLLRAELLMVKKVAYGNLELLKEIEQLRTELAAIKAQEPVAEVSLLKGQPLGVPMLKNGRWSLSAGQKLYALPVVNPQSTT